MKNILGIVRLFVENRTFIQVKVNFMIERDYIMRLVRMFFDALEKLFEKAETEPLRVEQELKSMYAAYFGKSESYFYKGDVDDILAFLKSAYPPKELLYRVEMLAELLFRDAIIKTSACEKTDLLGKSVWLFEYLDRYSDTFSFERRRKIAEIRDLIKK